MTIAQKLTQKAYQEGYREGYRKGLQIGGKLALVKIVYAMIDNGIYPMDFKMHRGGKGANPREHR